MESIAKLASKNAVVIFSKSSCCISHSIKRLFYDLGVSPMIYELDDHQQQLNIYHNSLREIEDALMRLGCNPSVPAVFIGGKFVGSSINVMTLLLNGSLKKMLKEAGALWL